MLKLVVGVAAGTILVAYCVYFDMKRRQDPEYKKKIHARRSIQQEPEQVKPKQKTVGKRVVPVFEDPESWKRYFMQELQTAQEMLVQGRLDDVAEHLANAWEISINPEELLDIWKNSLQAPIFMRLVEVLQERNLSMAAAEAAAKETGTEELPNMNNATEENCVPSVSGVAMEEID